MPQKGLTNSEVIKQRSKFGSNALPQSKSNGFLKSFVGQFESPLIILLIITAIVSALFKEYADAFLIFFVTILNVFIGFTQEYQAQKTLDSLKKVVQPTTIVIRNSKRKKIEIDDLVPDDIVVLGSGDIIPADGIVLETQNLLVNEAILTGEHEALNKQEKDTLFMGTSVLSGRAIMQIVTTGASTEIGKIGQELIVIKTLKTPLQINLQKFANTLIKVVIGICLVIFISGLLYGREFFEMAQVSIILAIAAVPTGFPIIVTIILALGMKRILSKKGLIKNLASVETLGSTSVICTDKTGTLTIGKMEVIKSKITDEDEVIKAIGINNEQRTNFELALWNYAKGMNSDLLETSFNRKKTYIEAFSSDTKYALSKLADNSVYVVGAPDIVIEFCKMNFEEKKSLMKEIDTWAEMGLRVIGIAKNNNDAKNSKKNYTWLGLLGIEDPLRKEAHDAILKAQKAGIAVKIVTGDYLPTAKKIAEKLGFICTKDTVIEGKELDKIDDNELKKRVRNITVFARVTPMHKLRIVKALQANDEIVAMTGDGVNDVLALKKADIGVVMGDSSEIAKEASDLILLDNNFQTIVQATEEGRLIYTNLKKIINFILSNSFAEIILISIAMVVGLPAPLSVIQILLIHLVCDGPSDIALGFDNIRSGLLKKKPKYFRDKGILGNKNKVFIFLLSSIIALTGLSIFLIYFKDLELARSAVFAFIGFSSFMYIFSFRDLNSSMFNLSTFQNNKFLVFSIIYSAGIILAGIYLHPLNEFMGIKPLPAHVLGYVLLNIGFIILVVELLKKGLLGSK